jgi:hypothetical protein
MLAVQTCPHRRSFLSPGTRTPDEVVAKVKTFRAQDASGLMSTCKTEISAKAVPAASAASSGSAAAPTSSSAVPKSSPGLSAAAAPDAPAAAAEEDDWTSSEQKALEVPNSSCQPSDCHRFQFVICLQMALKEFPPSMAPADRWKAISTR